MTIVPGIEGRDGKTHARLGLPAPSVAPQEARTPLPHPSPGSYYHGVHVGNDQGEEDAFAANPELLDSYLRGAGQPHVAWVYFSHEWSKSRAFPQKAVDLIHGRGSVPFIRLMLRTAFGADDNGNAKPERVFTLKAINEGQFDRDLEAWGAAARQHPGPLIVEWGTEMNGRWFSWNAKWNGRNRREGAGLFKSAYQRIVDKINAPNVTWVFHVNAWSDPRDSWNDLKNYYPDPGYVDWFGVSAYGAQKPGDACTRFADSMENAHKMLGTLEGNDRIPVFVLEFGAARNAEAHPVDGACTMTSQCQPHAWADEAFNSILGEGAKRWRLHGFSWWNEAWGCTDMRVEAISCLPGVFRRHLKRENVVHRPIPRGR